MADRPRFGPAGVPSEFKELKRPVEEFPKYLREEGLAAFEYQATRWGPKPQMKEESAEKLRVNAKENDVWLTVHGSYFINFCGDEATIEASKNRLISCVIAAEWMGGHMVVFHPGFYGGKSPQEALKICAKAMNETLERLKALGIAKVHFGPETMGKKSQLGTLNEVLTLCESVEQTEPVIDWAHIHARGFGLIKTKDDYAKILSEIENRLGTKAVESLHVHYTLVEFTEKGEKMHHTMSELGYGPSFRPFAELIHELDLKPVVISESPVLDQDSIKMRDMFLEIKKG
jgi:deoxyribonuclease-4